MLLGKLFSFLLTTTAIVSASELYIRAVYTPLNTEDLLEVRDEELLIRDELYRRGELVLDPGEPLGGWSVLEARDTQHCSNKGKLKRPKYHPDCLPSDSRGFRSAHNCKRSGGKTYLCVQRNVATCYVSMISEVSKLLPTFDLDHKRSQRTPL